MPGWIGTVTRTTWSAIWTCTAIPRFSGVTAVW